MGQSTQAINHHHSVGNSTKARPDSKNYNDQAEKLASRGIIGGPIKGPSVTPRVLHHYDNEGINFGLQYTEKREPIGQTR